MELLLLDISLIAGWWMIDGMICVMYEFWLVLFFFGAGKGRLHNCAVLSSLTLSFVGSIGVIIQNHCQKKKKKKMKRGEIGREHD